MWKIFIFFWKGQAMGHKQIPLRVFTPERIEQFFRSLKPNGECLEWQGGSPSIKGYGRLQFGKTGGWFRTHRVAYAFAYGADPADLMVLHSCDNPRCCNPQHLRLGTAADNHADLKARPKGRKPIGEQCALAIHEMLLEGVPWATIAERTGVTMAAVERVREGTSYGNLTGRRPKPEDKERIILRGKQNKSAKITDAQAQLLYKLHFEHGHTQASLMRLFGLSCGLVSLMCRGKYRKQCWDKYWEGRNAETAP